MEGLFKLAKYQTGKRMSCIACGLYKKARHPKMKVQGKGKKGILLVGTAPNTADDSVGSYWNGKGGRALVTALKKQNIDINKDCFSIQAISCHSDNKKNISIPVTDACRKNVLQAIDDTNPHVIIAFGEIALHSIIGDRLQGSTGTMHKWRGWGIPDRKHKAWVLPVFSAEYLENNQRYKEVLSVFEMDLSKVPLYLDKKLPKQIDEQDSVTVLDREKEIKKFLNRLQSVAFFALDIETTGIKPHDKPRHKIGMTSFAFNSKESFVIPGELSKKNKRLLKQIMENPSIGKIAQNMKYEHTWYYNLYGIEIKGWLWDTMQATHILDNRSGITGLKFQAIVQFGVFDYDSEVSPYLKSPGKGANEVNRLQEVLDSPILRQKMSVYCGVDSLLTYKLAKLQMKLISTQPRLKQAYDLTHEGILSLFKAEQQGMRVDVPYTKKQIKKLSKRIELGERRLDKTELVKQWRSIYKGKFSFKSNSQLEHLLYTVKEIKPPKRAKGGGGSTDEETLRLLDMPELDILLQTRKHKKLRDYLESFLREQVNGIMHTSFNLHIPVTYRSSSNNPNFQNMPTRDKESMQVIRRAIYPSLGNQLMEIDFSKLEVSIAACYHKDPVMMEYLTSSSNDMHGDLAKQIFKVDDFDKHLPEHGYLRSAAKNGFIFPQFYGDYYVGNAESLRQWAKLPQGAWKKGMGVSMPGGGSLATHMRSKGIFSFAKFTKHLKSIEYDFWNRRFRIYKKWKDTWVAAYQKNGYFEMKTGYRCSGVMRRNEVINYPVQGAAFHCLLWSFNRITYLLEKNGFKSKVIGQIHDAIVFDIYPPERERVWALAEKVTTKELPRKWKWLIAPLAVEADICGIDEPWSMKKEYLK